MLTASRNDVDYDEPAPRRSNRRARRAVTPKQRHKAKLWHKLVLSVGLVMVMLSGGTLIFASSYISHIEGMVDKEDILTGLPGAVAPAAGQPLNYLVLGTDTRSEAETTSLEGDGNRADVIMIVHVSKDRKSAFIMSIPRDSYVNVPAVKGHWNGGKNKINSAMAFGGAKHVAQTVYDLTKIQLNGAVLVNFQGIQNMVAAVGGVNVCIPYKVDSFFSDKVWDKGCHFLNAKDAEEFVRQRHGVPGGDLGRIKNQQHVIKGLVAKAKQGDTLTNPTKFNALVSTAAQSLTIDKSMNLMELATQLKDISQEAIKFGTTPVTGTANTDAGSSVLLDDAGAQELFKAVRDDQTDAWLALHPQPEVASLN